MEIQAFINEEDGLMSFNILDFYIYVDPIYVFFDGVSDFSDVMTRYVSGVVNLVVDRINSLGRS